MNRLAALSALLFSVMVFGSAPGHATQMRNGSQVDQALGRQGKDLPGGVHKVGFPRADLT